MNEFIAARLMDAWENQSSPRGKERTVKLHQIAIWRNGTLFANVPCNNDAFGVHSVAQLPWDVKECIIQWFDGAKYLTQLREWRWGWRITQPKLYQIDCRP